MNYYERHIGDYLKDTAHLSLLEHGIYTRLMDVYYTRETPIPLADAARLIGARSRDEREALQSVLSEFFEIEADAYVQHRCDNEIRKFADKSGKAKRSAMARWDAKRSESDGNANAYTDAMRTHSDGIALAMLPIPNPQSPVTKHHKPPTPKGVVDVPEWIPEKPWADFVAMRRAKGAKTPFTVAAAKGIIEKLDGFRSAGYDISTVLQESVINGWSGVFEPKAQARGGVHGSDWTGSAT